MYLVVLAAAVSSAQSSKQELVPVIVADEARVSDGELADTGAMEGPDSILDCAAGTVPCGSSHCVPVGGVCCASAGHEELYCPSGQTCTTDGRCTSGGGGGGGGGCGSGQKACGNFCIPSTGECCNTSSGTYCAAGTTCTGGGTSCVGTGGGGGGGCAGGTATQASCGGDTCGCADSCSNASQCESGCCANGYCSPSCVCAGQGSLTVNCGGGGGYDDSGGRSGCDAGSGATGEGLALLTVGLAAVLWPRKRRSA